MIDKKMDTFSKAKWRIIGGEKFALVILTILILSIFLLIVLRPTPWKAERKASKFLEQIITSINKETDFYKKNSEERTIKDIDAYISMISDNYEVRLFNYEGLYEYFVTFDKKHTFKVDISKTKGAFILKNFYLLDEMGKRVRM